MQPIGPGRARRPWEPPAITKLAISTETKAAAAGGPTIGSKSLHSSVPASGEPQPPAASAMKLGFSFEWSLPLSARTE